MRLPLIPLMMAIGLAQDIPNSIPLSKLMEELSRDPQAREQLFRQLDMDPAAGRLLGAEHLIRLKKLVVGKDWKNVDRFPGITISTLTRAAKLAGVLDKAEPKYAEPFPKGIEKLELPATEPVMNPGDLKKDLGFGLVWGEDPNPQLGKWHANSTRLAAALNHLALANGELTVVTAVGKATTPEGLIGLLQKAGNQVEVRDARYFANFGDLRYQGQDVITPFWVDTELPVPGTKRTLLVPVGHSQHEIWVTGPINAVVSIYFGIDGKSEFRSMDTRDQTWVLGHTAHTYRDAQLTEVIRSAASIVRAYHSVQAKNPELPYSGYFRLGVCNDVSAMLEQHMQGKPTLYPLTLNAKYFEGQGEVEEWAKAIPTDGGRPKPGIDRILGSIPVSRLEDLPFPELREDLEKIRLASISGELDTSRDRGLGWGIAAILLLVVIGLWMNRRKNA